MAWCLVKHRDNFTFNVTFTVLRGNASDSFGKYSSNPGCGSNSLTEVLGFFSHLGTC
jgi:hypothetical protein